MVRFDVIIPVHNSSAYLKKCLNSVLNQSYKNFRIIVIDDKSTDNSVEILRKYKEKFPEIITLIESKVNVKAAGARNLGLDLIEADYITFLDSDDTLDLNFFEKVNNIIESYNPDIVVGDICFNCGGVNLDFLGMKRNVTENSTLIKPSEFKKHIYTDRPGVTGKFFKKDLIKTRFPNIKWEDYPFGVTYLTQANSIYYLKEIGYHYTINPFSTTVTDIFKFPPRVLDIFTGSDIIDSTLDDSTKDHYKDELRTVKTINCLQRVRDLCFARNISKKDKFLMANYLVNLINVKEGNYQELDYYHYQKNSSLFYRFRIETVEKLIDKNFQIETDEQVLKEKIKTITKKYEK